MYRWTERRSTVVTKLMYKPRRNALEQYSYDKYRLECGSTRASQGPMHQSGDWGEEKVESRTRAALTLAVTIKAGLAYMHVDAKRVLSSMLSLLGDLRPDGNKPLKINKPFGSRSSKRSSNPPC